MVPSPCPDFQKQSIFAKQIDNEPNSAFQNLVRIAQRILIDWLVRYHGPEENHDRTGILFMLGKCLQITGNFVLILENTM